MQKMLIFYKETLTSAKLIGSWHWKVYFLKLHPGVYLRTKFQVSSITLTSFGRGNFTPSPPSQNSTLKSPPRLGLMDRTRSLYSGHKGKSKLFYVLKTSAGITSSVSLSEIDYVAVDGFGMSHLLQKTEKIKTDLVNAVYLWVDNKKKFCSTVIINFDKKEKMSLKSATSMNISHQ